MGAPYRRPRSVPAVAEVSDVVIVGAGSAGAVVAARVSEDPNRTVLLIDAGPDYPLAADLPDDLRDGRDNSYVDHDWGLAYSPTVDGREGPFPRGRVVGGSSAVNTAIALRPAPEDCARWAELGNPEWAWDRVLPALRRLERDLDFGHEPHHGDAGPITIRRHPPDELVPTHQAFLDAADRLGYDACPDANHPTALGAGPQPMNKLGRLRVSVAIGYLAPARHRDNLRILGGRRCRRVLVEAGRAVGVEVETADGAVEVHRARLVVVSAGAVHTPGVLVRSGIGDRRELDRLGIDVVADVPGVGAGLQDHPAVAVVARLRDPSLAAPDLPLIQTILRSTAPGSEHRADLQIELITRAARRPGEGLIAIAAVLEQCESRGEVRQTSADPASAPRIEPRFCVDDRDATRLAAALDDAVAFTRTGPLAELIDEVVFPAAGRAFDLDARLHVVRTRSGSGYHPTGTARMGPAGDPGAVVDERGRCHAVDGLVVADASILPTVPRANTNLSSIAVGERVGEWLRTDPATYGR